MLVLLRWRRRHRSIEALNLPGHNAVQVGVKAVALYECMRRFMDHRHSNPVHASAVLLFQNAVNFGRPASDAADGNDVVYRIAIAVELLLKACLAAAGIPDTIRTAIGHDLRVAASLAKALGIDLPAGHGNLLRHIHPHFRDGGIHRYPARRWSDAFVRDARTVIGQLTEHVEAYIQNGDHRHEQLRAGIVDRLPPAASEIFRRAVAGDTLTEIAALMHLTPAYVERTLTAAVRSTCTSLKRRASIRPDAAIVRMAIDIWSMPIPASALLFANLRNPSLFCCTQTSVQQGAHREVSPGRYVDSKGVELGG